MQTALILIANGANVLATDNNGMTPLMAAAQAGREQLVQLLLDYGVNVSTTDNRGWNAENYAAAGEHLEVVAMLEAEAATRAKCVAFAMGHHARLGVGSRVQGLHPELLRMVLEYV